MLLDIRAAFDEMVTELDWMDAGTRARAHKKLHAMRPFVGFPDWITNPKELDKFYEGVSFPEFYHMFTYNHKYMYILAQLRKLQYLVCLGRGDRWEAVRDFAQAN